MPNDYIKIKGASIHNLKNIDIEIPKGKLTVITGVSGSGKSSLAFDILYEEGKRRYLMFSGASFMVDNEPGVESITGFSPTVAVEQRVTRQANPHSTVGTRTKIESMLAALFAAYGERHPDYDDGQPMSMAMFQKNSPRGMCVKCLGKGSLTTFDEEKLFSDLDKRLDEVCMGLGKHGKTRDMLNSYRKAYGLDSNTTLGMLTDEQLNALKYGIGGKSSFMGYIPWIMQIINGIFSSSGRLAYLMRKDGLLETVPCLKCGGSGIGEQAAHTTIKGKTIKELEDMYIRGLLPLSE